MGVSDPRLPLCVTVLVCLFFFGPQLGAAGKKLRWGFGLMTAFLILMGSAFTGPTMKWGVHKVQADAPKEVFDPKATPNPTNPGATAIAKFERQPDGSLKAVPLAWKTNRHNGLPLSEPGTAEYWEELNEYNAQESQPKVATDEQTGLPTKAVQVRLAPGESWSVEPQDLVGGSTFDYNWSTPTGRVLVRVYPHSGPDPIGKACISGPGVKERCDLPYADYPKLTFTAMEATEFIFTAVRTG
jgi:hypothetical protein